MKNIYVTLAKFLTHLKKLYKNIQIIRVSLSSKNGIYCRKKQFFLRVITADDISQEIKRLDINKATQESDIPAKLVKPFFQSHS